MSAAFTAQPSRRTAPDLSCRRPWRSIPPPASQLAGGESSRAFDCAFNGAYVNADARIGRPGINRMLNFSLFQRINRQSMLAYAPSSGEANMDVRGKAPIFPPVEPAPKSIDSRHHSDRPIDAGFPPVTRKRVVLLPHAPNQPILDPISAAQVAHDSEVAMEHSRKRWLGVVAAATVLAGGLASIFHRDNATVPRRQSLDRCSAACPCGTI